MGFLIIIVTSRYLALQCIKLRFAVFFSPSNIEIFLFLKFPKGFEKEVVCLHKNDEESKPGMFLRRVLKGSRSSWFFSRLCGRPFLYELC